MGTGFTIDTPVKVAKYGISSVISLVDDTLIEEMRQYYCQRFKLPYTPITKNDEDYRARRITKYLNLIDRIVKNEFKKVRSAPKRRPRSSFWAILWKKSENVWIRWAKRLSICWKWICPMAGLCCKKTGRYRTACANMASTFDYR